jgi:hypothetical protein
MHANPSDSPPRQTPRLMTCGQEYFGDNFAFYFRPRADFFLSCLYAILILAGLAGERVSRL